MKNMVGVVIGNGKTVFCQNSLYVQKEQGDNHTAFLTTDWSQILSSAFRYPHQAGLPYRSCLLTLMEDSDNGRLQFLMSHFTNQKGGSVGSLRSVSHAAPRPLLKRIGITSVSASVDSKK